MTLKAGKEMDRRCVVNWLNEVYVTPSRAFSEYTDDELKMFAHDALILLEDRGAKTGHWILDPDGMDWNIPAWKCSECGNIHNGLPIMDCDEMNIYLYAGSRFCPNCGTRMEERAVK